jgi:hypothetical protein
MGNWKKRLREIRDRNPNALPSWSHSDPHEEAWYRVSWQTENGVPAEDAARPAILLLGWLAGRSLLTQNGLATLCDARIGDVASLALTRSMVSPKGGAFLDQQWETWWETHGINLVISANCSETALTGIEECWRSFGTGDDGQA